MMTAMTTPPLRIALVLPAGQIPSELRSWLDGLIRDRRIEIVGPLAGASELSDLPSVDLVVNLRDEPLDESVASNVRLGVLSIDPPPNDWRAAYVAVCERKAGTQFCVRLRQRLALPEKAIVAGAFRTQSSLRRNRAEFARRSLFYLHHAIGMLAEGRAISSFPDAPARRQAPLLSSGAVLRHGMSALAGGLRALARRMRGEAEKGWSVGLLHENWRTTDFSAPLVLDPPQGRFVADPFLVERDGRKVCFVEEYDHARGKGSIAAYDVSAAPRRIGTAIEEGFHLSFPFVFTHQGALFMTPECAGARQIRLYRCVQFPMRWELAKVLMEDVSAADPVIFPHDGRWWLFANINPLGAGDHCSELWAFHAEAPDSTDWMPHRRNPLVIDPRRARNGGLILDGAALFRVSQEQRFGVYGADCAIRRIVRLDPDHYEEDLCRQIEPDEAQGLTGLHHVSSLGNLTAFDFSRFR